MPAPRTSSHIVGSEIIASLMWGEKTINQLAEATGVNRKSVREWVAAMRKSGVVRIESPGGGCKPMRYAIQAKPFELPDAAPIEDF